MEHPQEDGSVRVSTQRRPAVKETWARELRAQSQGQRGREERTAPGAERQVLEKSKRTPTRFSNAGCPAPGPCRAHAKRDTEHVVLKNRVYYKIWKNHVL